MLTLYPLAVRGVAPAVAALHLVTGPRHFTQVERLLGAQAHVWFETPRRRLYANRPPNGST